MCSYQKKEYLDEIMERERIKEYTRIQIKKKNTVLVM